MHIQFILHLLVVSYIMHILATGCNIYLKVKGSLDLSYVAIVLFGAYASVLLHIHFWRWILASTAGACVLAMPFSFIVLQLSKRLEQAYFVIWTLALYLFVIQVASEWQGLTWGVFWLSGFKRIVIQNISVNELSSYLRFSGIIAVLLSCCMYYFRKTLLYRILQWRWEKGILIKALWITSGRAIITMLILTTLFAVISGSLYAFYFLYIDPQSFWLSLLLPLLVISLLTFRMNEWYTFLITLIITFLYEYLRFFKFISPAHIWYVREVIFASIYMILAFIVFRNMSKTREV